MDNDAAGDQLAEITSELFERVITLLKHPRGHKYDDAEIGELFVRIEILFALYDRDMISSAPSPELLQELITLYQQRWEKYHLDAGHSVPATRKKSMADTFAQLIEIAEELQSSEYEFQYMSLDEVELNDADRVILDIFDSIEKQGDQDRD